MKPRHGSAIVVTADILCIEITVGQRVTRPVPFEKGKPQRDSSTELFPVLVLYIDFI